MSVDHDALRDAVRRLLDDPRTDPGLEVVDAEEAAYAVRLLDQGLREGPGIYRTMAEGAQRGAETLSSDPLQALSEFVQNADDAGADRLRVLWRPHELLIAHDGAAVRLGDVLLLGMPWVSGKSADAQSTGRFGIGLATLRALTTTWEVHCHPFHVRFTNLALAPVAPPELPDDFTDETSGPRWTVFRIPLEPGRLTASQLFRWFDDWSDASLLFLRNLGHLEVADGERATALTLSWEEAAQHRALVGGADTDVHVRHATATDGAVWRVYTAHVPCRRGWERHHKALGAATPVAVALPLRYQEHGSVHAGLPVAPLDAAVRVHAQFDPVASREGFAGSSLNQQLVPLVADLWEAAVQDVLSHVDPTAWHLVPLAPTPGATPPDRLPDRVRAALLTRARESLAVELSLPVADGGPAAPLAEFAVEDAELSGVFDHADIARLTGAPYAFPPAARDRRGRWRQVLEDWREEGTAKLGPQLRITDALRAFEEDGHDVTRLIRLAAVAIQSGHGYALLHQPCVVTADGHRLRPSDHDHAFAEGADEASGTLDPLGVVLDLHPAHWDENPPSKQVIAWLRQHGRLVHRDDTAAVLRIIARLGERGHNLPCTTGEEGTPRLVALQRALGEVSSKLQKALGPGIGLAVRLDGFAYDDQGKEQLRQVQPRRAYLSQALQSTDGDRFPVAARRTPGLVWVHRSYARSLLAAAENNGLSRTAFLRLLGVADTPRITPVSHHGQDPSYFKTYQADSRVGLARRCMWWSADRGEEMYDKDAGFTLDDLVSDDLVAVVASIAAERDIQERRRRTAALLRTLASPLNNPEQARVPLARADRRWHVQGTTWAMWIWRLRDTSWLEDAHGKLRAPAKLQLRTPAAEALYGNDDPNYLHPDLHKAARTDVLTVLGVSGDPDIPRLLERLHDVRERSAEDSVIPDGDKADALLVYRALARRLTERSPDISPEESANQIRQGFLGEELVVTDQGWATSRACFRGPSILRGFRPFALTGAELDPLWRALRITEPEAEDLADVLKEIAQTSCAPEGRHQQVMLDALRGLRDRITAGDNPAPLGLRNKLRPLPLWTTTGWTKARPVFAVDHPGVEQALGEQMPLWKPGGGVRQFAPLFALLRVTPLDVSEAQVIGGQSTPVDRTLTGDFRRAVVALQDLLVRDEPEAAESFTGWAWLADLEVRLHPGLRIRLEPGSGHEPVELPVDSQVDRSSGTIFLRSPEALRTRPGAGMAIAPHFSAERSRIGHRWRDVWEDGLVEAAAGSALMSAGQQDHEDRQRLAEQLRLRQQETSPELPGPATRKARRARQRRAAGAQGGVPTPRPAPDLSSGSTVTSPPAPQPPPAPRRLVNAAELDKRPRRVTRIVTPLAPTGLSRQPGSTPPAGTRRQASSLPKPRPGSTPSPGQFAPKDYGHHHKEELVLRTLRRILHEDGIALNDQRHVSAFGADAFDSAGRYYEIKAHGGQEPPELSLTSAEFVRARAEGENYTLVIASYLEEGTGTPTLRLVTDPVNRFEPEPSSDVRLKGIRDAEVESTVYEWPAEE